MILEKSSFNPARGGHAPGDVRDAFSELVEKYSNWKAGEEAPVVELREQIVRVPELCGLLWSCSDCMPSSLRTVLEDLGADLTSCFSYAKGARELKTIYVGLTGRD